MYTMKHTSIGSTRYPYWININLCLLCPVYKIISRWSIDLNIKGKMIKFSEENTGAYLGLGRFHTLKSKLYTNQRTSLKEWKSKPEGKKIFENTHEQQRIHI